MLQDITCDDDLKEDMHQHLAIVCNDRVVILIEREIIVECTNLSDAFLPFFALHYLLDLQYHARTKTTMEFVQKVVVKLGSKAIPSKLRNLMDKIAKMRSE